MSKIKLSDHFTAGRLFRFVLPSVAMMVFISIYGVVDGFFVSNFAGKTSFASINLIMPFVMILGGVGFRSARAERRLFRRSSVRVTKRRQNAISQ